jgi:hypothetical protein
LIRLSPSTVVTIRRGTPRRRAISVAASGSVGATTAPSTNDGAHPSPTTAWATAATARTVASTAPIARKEIAPTFTRRSRRDVKNVAE